MTIDEMIEKKIEFGLSYEQIAKKSGLPIGTVQKVLGRITKHPRYDTLYALEKVFTEKQSNAVHESSNYGLKKKAGYTIDDYMRLPEDQRVELIDGVFYDMAAPTSKHQLVAGEIFRILRNYISSQGGDCIPLISPIDVQLDKDDKTVVQPDVIVICDRDKFQNGRVFGAPDFVTEVVSPSSGMRDMTLKAAKYRDAGVREYWIVDPGKERILVYYFENEEAWEIYSFQDEIPVRLYEGNIQIDFKEIADYISFLDK